MSQRVLWLIAGVAAIAVLAGCKSADDEFAPSVPPNSFKFEGKLEPKYAGEWKTLDGTSTVNILKDGGLKVETTSRSMKGKSVVNVSGHWLANQNDLMFEYVDKAKKPIVLKYSATISGNTLTLQQTGGRVETTYKRT